jgi:hypothetical protein
MLSAHPEPQSYGTHASTEDYGGSCPITDILRVLWRRFALTCNLNQAVYRVKTTTLEAHSAGKRASSPEPKVAGWNPAGNTDLRRQPLGRHRFWHRNPPVCGEQTGATEERALWLTLGAFQGSSRRIVMPKFAKPWCRKGRGWYVTLDGKQIALGLQRKAAFELYHDLMRRPLVRVLDWQACDDVVPEHEGNVGDQLQAAAQRGKNRIGTEVGSNSTAVTPSCCR